MRQPNSWRIPCHTALADKEHVSRTGMVNAYGDCGVPMPGGGQGFSKPMMRQNPEELVKNFPRDVKEIGPI